MINRLIKLDGTFNFRDIGGYETADGRRVVCKKLYRADALNKLTDADLKRLCEMDIQTVVDFRMAAEQAAQPDRVPDKARLITLSPIAAVAAQASASAAQDDAKKLEYLEKAASSGKLSAVSPMIGQMRELVTEKSAMDAFGAFLRLIIDKNAVPLVFHCKGGKDRTGWAAALTLCLLGVPRETVLADYMLTAEYGKQRNDHRMAQYRQYTQNEEVLAFLYSLMKTDEAYLQAAFEETDKKGGIESYAATYLSFSQKDTEKLRKMYLE